MNQGMNQKHCGMRMVNPERQLVNYGMKKANPDPLGSYMQVSHDTQLVTLGSRASHPQVSPPT